MKAVDTCLLLALLVVLSLGIAVGEDLPNPSFSCAKAKTLDEKTICSDARLAELDRLQAAAYLDAMGKDRRQAINDAKRRLEERSLCGNDRVCLLDAMRYAEGIPTPTWVDSYRDELVRDVLKDDLTMRSYGLVGKRGSFPIDAKGVQATLIEIDGVDTDHALARGKTTPADYLEYCERDPGGLTSQYGGKLTIAQCARQERVSTPVEVLLSRANCRAKQVTLWDGTWRFLRYEDAITWKSPRGQVAEPWGGTAAVDAQFQLLCPNTFARIRADAADRQEEFEDVR